MDICYLPIGMCRIDKKRIIMLTNTIVLLDHFSLIVVDVYLSNYSRSSRRQFMRDRLSDILPMYGVYALYTGRNNLMNF